MRIVSSLLLIAIFALFAASAQAASAPDFELKNLDGDKVSLDDLLNRDKLLIIDFWNVGCKPCNELLPHLQDYYDKYKKDGVEVVIISKDTPLTQAQVEPFFKSNGYSFEVLLDGDQEVSGDYGVKASPATFVINGDGDLIYQHYGYKSGQETEVEDIIKRYLAGENIDSQDVEGQD
jgi:cytochrome c biogenesis protein CcmG, thiol:disulfide interchange protein DsbE